MFHKLTIRSKLLAGYSMVIIISISLGSAFIYRIIRENIETGIESELTNSTTAIFNMVKTSAAVSIKNRLRAVAEKNLDIVRHFHAQYQKGAMTESRARKLASSVLLSQTIGKSGYIYCIDTHGSIVVHPQPSLLGTDVSGQAFIQEQLHRKKGYMEYDWKNPGESSPRPKALFMTYFAPWDWIISVSTYRDEFQGLINVDDFRKSILDLRFGDTGYSYVIDRDGNAVIHPKIQGLNIHAFTKLPDRFLQEMLRRKSGKIIHSWKNPEESTVRKKLVIYNAIPELNWIVASSSYLDEFYGPLDTIRNLFIGTVIVTLLLVLPLTFTISSSITRPLRKLMKQFDRMIADDFTFRMKIKSQDEIGQLSAYFNRFMDQLQTYNTDLKKQILERRLTEEALRESEERYRSVMEAAPDPVVIYDMEGLVTYLNPAFTRVFGWTSAECRGKTMDHFVPRENWTETRMMIDMIISGKTLSSIETRRYTQNGEIVEVSVNGAAFRDRKGRFAGSVVILRDITRAKRLEKQVMNIGDRERQRIGQDLHDDLCPHLIGTQGLCMVLKNNLEADCPGNTELAGRIAGLIEDAIWKTRALARGLCPVHLVSHGLQAALENLMIHTETTSGISCSFTADDAIHIRDNGIATHLYYIAQEAVNNAVKYSGASRIDMELQQDGRHTCLRIADNGRGFPDTPSTEGIGLQIMEYRARMISASFEMDTRKNSGTTIRVCFRTT